MTHVLALCYLIDRRTVPTTFLLTLSLINNKVALNHSTKTHEPEFALTALSHQSLSVDPELVQNHDLGQILHFSEPSGRAFQHVRISLPCYHNRLRVL